jgi:hypothetical protein
VAVVTVFLSVVDQNLGDGVHADATGIIWVSQSELNNNHGVPWSVGGSGQIFSYGDNTVSSPSPTPNATKH